MFIITFYWAGKYKNSDQYWYKNGYGGFNKNFIQVVLHVFGITKVGEKGQIVIPGETCYERENLIYITDCEEKLKSNWK